MVLSLLIYTALLAGSLLLSIEITDSLWLLPLVLFAFLLCLPVFVRVLFVFQCKRVTAQFLPAVTTGNIGQKLDCTLSLSQAGRLPVTRCNILVKYDNAIYQYRWKKKIKTALPARGETVIDLSLCSQHCGQVTVKVEKVCLYSLFHLFRRTLRPQLKKAYAILPAVPVTVGQVRLEESRDEEAVQYANRRGGNDPAEVFELRDYYPGDRMQRVHWKLSEKTGDLLVREFAPPVSRAADLVVELNGKSPELVDGLFSAMLAISQSLLSQKVRHEICWYNHTAHCFYRYPVTGEEALYSLAGEILSTRMPVETGTAEALEHYAGEAAEHAHLIYCTTDEEAADHPAFSSLEERATAVCVGKKSGEEELRQVRMVFVDIGDIPRSLSGIVL